LPDLAGRNEAPPLAGQTFMNAWRTRTTKDLVEYMQATMPPNAATLSAEQYLAIASFILQSNGAAAGAQPLTASAAIAIGSVATGAAAATAAGGQGLPAEAAGGGRAAAAGRGPTVLNGPTGLVVSGQVKNYTAVTDDMLRNPSPADWLMARRNYQGWSHSPLTQIT